MTDRSARHRTRPEHDADPGNATGGIIHVLAVHDCPSWCCTESDGHPYFGDYSLGEDGSVVLNYEGQRYVIPDQLVLKGTNPTGHAVWWFLEGPTGRTTYCFAPGTLS